MPVVRADALARRELELRPAPERPPELLAEAPLAARELRPRLRFGQLVEEVQKPIPSGGGSGLAGRPSRAGPSLYSEGATSFGPSA
jgi:hypothetical protein